MHLALPLVLAAIQLVAADDAPSYTSPSAFERAMLDTTNQARRAHNASDLSWNQTLVEFAADVVDKCEFKHSGGPYGENLATGYENVSTAVGVWRDERDSYDYRAGKFSLSTGHFTQLVWKASTQLGCARANCTGKGDASGWFVVCEYFPPGNVQGAFAENVQRQEGTSEAAGRRSAKLAWIGAVVAVSAGLWW
ncbi:SCP-like extracellular protein [Phaeosphaeria sp. MPI-PUGE-AT-0046c]|nr:SCP-like extracellular protein [Phaeosphaeria sp. MPI-PUGE-AT-0046c]